MTRSLFGGFLPRAAVAIAVAASLTSVGACASEHEGGALGASGELGSGGKIQLLVTVDWEGRDLADKNLQAMKDLHSRFPQVKLVHFLNAAYFTKADTDANAVRGRIASVIAPGDEMGLHIHGWRRLFDASGVTFKPSPTFWGTSLLPSECIGDCGHEVPISLYSASELRQVVRFSLDTLESHGFGRARSFRCGGWMANDSVREAIAAEGLVRDESAVPTAFLAPQLEGRPLYEWLRGLWSETNATSQPYTIPTAAGDLVEVPDNGALADYVSADQMVKTFEANRDVFRGDRRQTVVVSIGFHQETAASFVPQLEAALTRIYATADRERLPLESVTTDAVVVPLRE